MLLAKDKVQHISTVAHEGKVIVFAVDDSGSVAYTVRQDGFEDSYLNTPASERTGWEKWQNLEFPNETDDSSVIEREKQELTNQKDPNRYILRSRYKSNDLTAVAPVQAISALGHVYVFRQSRQSTLLVDRFVLDGMTNKLNRKLEVRFKRSRLRHGSKETNKRGAGGLVAIDTPDFRDADGQFFYEPSTEICVINNLHDGWFSAVLVPTFENDVHRWHIFAYDSSLKRVIAWTIRASQDGLFEVQDYFVAEEENGAYAPRRIAGIIRRVLDIPNMTVNNGITATKYDLQQAQITQSGDEQLLKTATRVLLAIPTTEGIASLSFSMAKDGTLADISTTPVTDILRAKQRELLLPLQTLEEIIAIGDRSTNPQGSIQMLAEGNSSEDCESLITIRSDSSTEGLSHGDQVRITGTASYEGLYEANVIDTDRFVITPNEKGVNLGYWEKEDNNQAGLTFDGMITAYKYSTDGKIEITCPNHGLEPGDSVQIQGLNGCDSCQGVRIIDNERFAIERTWPLGQAINVRLLSQKRRGIIFDGKDDYIELAEPLPVFASSFSISVWIKVPTTSTRAIVLGDYCLENGSKIDIEINNGKLRFVYPSKINIIGTRDLRDNQWHCISIVRDKEGKKVYGYIDGLQEFVQAGELPDVVAKVPHWIGGDGRMDETLFEGLLSELRIWDRALSGEELRNQMNIQLTGREVGLVGYWRLGAISEGTVIDFTTNANDGVVFGDPSVSAVRLSRNLASGVKASIYSNDDLVAVSQRATYEESFEFRLISDSPVTLAYLENADSKKKDSRVFKLTYWGKTSRSSEEKISITAVQNKFEDLKNGWFRASAIVTIPANIALLRCFGIGNVTGEWGSLEIRKHRIREMADSISTANYKDTIKLSKLADQLIGMRDKLANLEIKEKEEAVLEAERTRLKWKISQYDSPDTEKRRYMFTQLIGKEAALAAEYKKQRESIFNYYCFISSCEGARNENIYDRYYPYYWRMAPVHNNRIYCTGHKLSPEELKKGNNDCLWEFFEMEDPWKGRIGIRSAPGCLGFWGGEYNIVGLVADHVGYTTPGDGRTWSTRSCPYFGDYVSMPLTAAAGYFHKNSQSRFDGDPLWSYGQLDSLMTFALVPKGEDVYHIETFETVGAYLQPDKHDYKVLTREEKQISRAYDTIRQIQEALHKGGYYDIDEKFLNSRLRLYADPYSYRLAAISPYRVSYDYRSPSGFAPCGRSGDGTWKNSEWRIIKDEVSINGAKRIEKARLALEDVIRQRMDLESSLNGTAEDRALWAARLKEVEQLLSARQTDLNTLNTAFCQGLAAMQAKPLALPSIATDRQGLSTKGAILAFVQPSSRLSALETCEGMVSVNFFDAAGVMQHLQYDVTADRANTTYEEWLPTALRSCLRLGPNESFQPTTPIALPSAWTVETWFYSPLPETTLASVLTQADCDEPCHHIALSKDGELGLHFRQPLNGKHFYGCGFNVAKLSEGWHHLAGVAKGDTTFFYIDGKKVGNIKEHTVSQFEMETRLLKSDDEAKEKLKTLQKAVFTVNQPIVRIGNTEAGGCSFGRIAEFRVWQSALTDEEIAVNATTLLSGNEPGLLAYYPLSEATGSHIRDHSGHGRDCIAADPTWWGCTARIGQTDTAAIPSSLVAAEYSTISLDNGRQQASMKRFFAYPTATGVMLLPEKRIEELELKWISNAQFAPTLLGYIEGPPPVPSENLTFSNDYNGATSVALTMSEDVAFSWNRSQQTGVGFSLDGFIGGGGTMSILTAPMGMGSSIETSAKIGARGALDTGYSFLNESTITSSASLAFTDSLQLRGTPEINPKFPHLGNRFIPKNIGYALVVSAMADVFVTRLKRSGKMIGYQVKPVDGIPPDVNTITFLMNPAYTMNGSLDGMTGSAATSDRFFKHVPEMRAQHGSLYPASYFRLREAYDLKAQIEAEDKRRESYFSNFNVNQVDETSLNRNIDTGDAPQTMEVVREEDRPAAAMSDAEKKAAQDKQADLFQKDSAAAAKQTSSITKTKQAEIQNRISDQDKRVQASNSFASWQKRMEDLQIRANKRNIVNTYVWDADGGLRTETQTFANTVEHTIGGSFSLNAALGVDSSFAAFGVDVELRAQATINLVQTMTKTESRSRGFELAVDLSGLEHRGITDYNDNPQIPGEKVDRYRFMSFYIEGSTSNFNAFFNYVVDPEWLRSNDEEARALRQAQAGKPNKAWRVLHRVTFVERPGLAGFGRDLRPLQSVAAPSETQQLLSKIIKVEEKNSQLESKLEEILRILRKG